MPSGSTAARTTVRPERTTAEPITPIHSSTMTKAIGSPLKRAVSEEQSVTVHEVS
jgi:hypothetical protein